MKKIIIILILMLFILSTFLPILTNDFYQQSYEYQYLIYEAVSKLSNSFKVKEGENLNRRNTLRAFRERGVQKKQAFAGFFFTLHFL